MARLIDADELIRYAQNACRKTKTDTVTYDWICTAIEKLHETGLPGLEKQERIIVELERMADEKRHENELLRECIVRMAMERCGVLNG